MSTPTAELGLSQAVDADDTADYLVTNLANSLVTVDSLFNATTGHTHTGAHQGGPVSPAVGSITSAMILDGTIVAADMAVNAVTNPLGTYQAVPTFSTTTTNTWLGTPANVGVTTHGGRIQVQWIATLQHTVAGAVFMFQPVMDSTPGTAMGQVGMHTTATLPSVISGTAYFSPAAGSHQFTLYVYMQTAGTLSAAGSIQWAFYVTEFLR